ncbi:MAG: hypothetical protein NTV73_18905 [Hyphomicrobiales bacterium]|nr:hypothetical protein [Hyphomicrobiales bacterium]
MKSSAGLLVGAAMLSVTLGACASQPAEPAAPPMVIAGGYGKADSADAGTKEAQAFAVAEIYKRNPTRALVEKADAQVQVVAGLNYEFDITMTGGSRYKIVVYRTLPNALSVTSYEKLN